MINEKGVNDVGKCLIIIFFIYDKNIEKTSKTFG